jgi:hypothetical protein
MSYNSKRPKPEKVRLGPTISDSTRQMLSSAKQRGRNPRSRHVTIVSPDGRVGGLPSILETAIFFKVHQRTMEARIRRSHEKGGHPGWTIPGRKGLYRAYFSDKGDPGDGQHRLDPTAPAPTTSQP